VTGHDSSNTPQDSDRIGNADSAGFESAIIETVDSAKAIDTGDAATEMSHARDVAVPDGPTLAGGRRSRLLRMTGYALLPAVTLALTGAAGYFKYQDDVWAETNRVRAQSVQIASEATVDLLSYTPDNAEAKLNAASDRLTGSFRDSYLSLVHDVVIPGAKQKRISAKASVPAGSSVSASADSAKVMVFVNQTVTVGNDGPTDTASVVEVNLEKVDGRWLISGFEPR
jgi:Mce-associated membrane protein